MSRWNRKQNPASAAGTEEWDCGAVSREEREGSAARGDDLLGAIKALAGK